jgi:hypothetical protein
MKQGVNQLIEKVTEVTRSQMRRSVELLDRVESNIE